MDTETAIVSVATAAVSVATAGISIAMAAVSVALALVVRANPSVCMRLVLCHGLPAGGK